MTFWSEHWEVIIGTLGYLGTLSLCMITLGRVYNRIEVVEKHIVTCNPVSERACLELRAFCQKGNCERRDRINVTLKELKEGHASEMRDIKLLISEVRKENADYNKAVMGHLIALNGKQT